MFILDPNFSILDPGSRVKKIPDPGSGSSLKTLSILTLKTVSKLSEKLSGMFIPGPGSWFFSPSRIPDPGVKKSPGSGSTTLMLEKVWGGGAAKGFLTRQHTLAFLLTSHGLQALISITGNPATYWTVYTVYVVTYFFHACSRPHSIPVLPGPAAGPELNHMVVFQESPLAAWFWTPSCPVLWIAGVSWPAISL